MIIRLHRPARGIRVAAIIPALALLCSAWVNAAPAPSPAPLFTGLGDYRGPRATPHVMAQRYFEQGVVLTWGFNPAEAARAFEAATQADPRCALCWWGLAWSLGPNVNVDMKPSDASRVRAALDHALALARTPRERGLVTALAARHPKGSDVVDESAYAKAMRALAHARPHDPEVAALAAEALLNVHPYDWWDAKGAPQPWTPEILHLLDRAIALQPRHAGAHHYRIHLLEASSHPERALADARALTSLVPASGHLLHMPAHIYMRTGRYDDAIAANRAAIAADARYLAEVDAQGAYRVGYVAHNQHFLWAAAAMTGRSEVALAAAQDAWPAACGPGRSDRSTGVLQQYYVLPLFTLVRFGRWGEILTDTLPPDVAEPYPLAIWHYARGTALAKTGRVDDARRELSALEMLSRDPALASVRVKNINPVESLMKIALLTLRADIASIDHALDSAVTLLRQATALEDALAYDEPHLWLAPTRHALGASLLAADRASEAQAVYGEDLQHYPENAWSLAGLAESLRRQGRSDEASKVDRRLHEALLHADVVIAHSRF
jgi:tetratricopeptide (TPR) repeat protein